MNQSARVDAGEPNSTRRKPPVAQPERVEPLAVNRRFSRWTLLPVGCAVFALVWNLTWKAAAADARQRARTEAKPGDMLPSLMADFSQQMYALLAYPTLLVGLVGAIVLLKKRVPPRKLVIIGLVLNVLVFLILTAASGK